MSILSTTMVSPKIGPCIAIVNESTVLTDAQVSAAVPDLQIQLDRDFAPIWYTSATLFFFNKLQPVPPNYWIIYVMDDSDQAGALGYHEITPTGMPIGKIFAKDDIQYNLSWTVTLSHELLEMIVDPFIVYTVFDQQTNTGGQLYALEIADAVEDDGIGYKINNTLVSNFVTPAWFEGFRAPHSTKFDFMGAVHSPFELAPGGYISVFDVAGQTGWQQITRQTLNNGAGPQANNRVNRPANPHQRRSRRK